MRRQLSSLAASASHEASPSLKPVAVDSLHDSRWIRSNGGGGSCSSIWLWLCHTCTDGGSERLREPKVTFGLDQARATSRSVCSLKLHFSLFHVDQPIGGVRATPFSSAVTAPRKKSCHPLKRELFHERWGVYHHTATIADTATTTANYHNDNDDNNDNNDDNSDNSDDDYD